VSATGVGIVFLWSVALPASLGTALGALLSARIPLAFLCLLSPLGLVFALRAFLHHLRSALRVPEDAAHLAPLAAWRALALTSGIELLLSAVVAVALGLATLSIVGWQALSLQGGLWTWVASS
jgi:FtsH-binding integral membrane protein